MPRPTLAPARQAIRLLSSAAIAALLGAGPCLAGDISYSVDETIGGGSVVGTITTDGNTGALSKADVVSWNLNLNGAGASTTLTSAGGQSVIVLEGNDLTATPTQLLFNFSNTDNGYVLFQANPGVFSGNKYYCLNTTSNVCESGASVVPASAFDKTAQFMSLSGVVVIGTTGPITPDAALISSIESLAQSRTAQMLVAQLESQLLLGLNEQVSCGNCGGAGMGFGSFAVSGHGRYALNPEWTLMGGLDLGQYKQKGADVTLNAGFATAIQYDPAGFGASRPYAEVSVSAGLQNTRYQRSYPSGAGTAIGVGATRDYNVSVSGQVGWVDRVTPRDEAAVYASYTRSWQIVGAYVEPGGAGNPLAATVPGGTDITDVAGLSAQYTHLFGRRIEADLNGGVDWAFNAKSGLRADINGFEIPGGQPSFVYYEVGGRMGVRVNRRMTVDLFLNGILAPGAIGSSLHGGFGARFDF
ncbi:MAG: hypothetical protein ACHP7N_15815 [Caulobacterales bacterium]